MFNWFGKGRRSAPPKRRARQRKGARKKTAITPANAGVFSQRMYASARQSRLTSGFGTTNSSADTELVTSLTTLRSRSRQLIRDAGYAKRAKVIVVNNVVGGGIGVQAQVTRANGKLNRAVNDSIEETWERFKRADWCHTGGELDMDDLERQVMGQVFDAGEVIVRKHFRPFGNSPIPYALELIEAERIADEFQFISPPLGQASRNSFRMGLEVDSFNRPVAYYLRERHPGELRFNIAMGSERVERVPASNITHLRVIDRWPQTRGEPWLHAAARKLNDMDGYTEAEIIAARGGACYMGVIETPDGEQNPLAGNKQADGSQIIELESGIVVRLNAGEKFNPFTPNRPNSAVDPFMRLMLREISASVGPSYESLSRDYSKSNYSSSRLALLDDRDLWKVLQGWFIRRFRNIVHREFLRQAVLVGEIPAINLESYALAPEKFEAVRFKPRGWGWIDPNKEVEAFKSAERAGYITKTLIIAQTANGADLEDVMTERQMELELIEEKGLQFDTDANAAAAPTAEDGTRPAAAPNDDDDDNKDAAGDGDASGRVVPISASR